MPKNTKISELIRSWAAAVQRNCYLLLPGCCVLCGILSKRPMDLCRGCEADLPFNQNACQCCSLPFGHTSQPSQDVETNTAICGACLSNPPSFSRCVAPLRYEFPANKLINQFKHHGRFSSGVVLAELLLDELRGREALPNLILPVPLHWRRQFSRGHNQAHWLGHYLGQRLGIALDTSLLSRQKHTPSQQGLPRQQRLKNLKGAFRLNRNLDIKSIALVDDVVTTGSTIAELSGLLRKAGARHIEIWCLARTPLEK